MMNRDMPWRTAEAEGFRWEENFPVFSKSQTANRSSDQNLEQKEGGENEMSTEDPLGEMPEQWDELYSAADTARSVLDVDITVSYDRSNDPEEYIDAAKDLVDQVTEAYKRRDELDRQMADELGNRLEDTLTSARSVATQARLGAQAAEDLKYIQEQLDDMELDDRTRELIDINDDIYQVGQEHGVFADDE